MADPGLRTAHPGIGCPGVGGPMYTAERGREEPRSFVGDLWEPVKLDEGLGDEISVFSVTPSRHWRVQSSTKPGLWTSDSVQMEQEWFTFRIRSPTLCRSCCGLLKHWLSYSC